MAYKNDSIQTIVSRYGKAEGACKNELYETYDRIRELAVSGNAMGGQGLVPFNSFLMNIARMFGAPSFSPMLGSEALTMPGTSFYAPMQGGTGMVPGGQASFGLAPFSNYNGFPTGGAAMLPASLTGHSGLGTFAGLANLGIGALGLNRFGVGQSWNDTADLLGGMVGGAASTETSTDSAWDATGSIVGGAGGLSYLQNLQGPGVVGGAAASAVGTAAGMGFGRNWVLPAASLLSGIGGVLTTLGPLFGPTGLVGVATGSILNGIAGTVLSGFQRTHQRVLANADIVLEEKVRNLEVTMKMLDTQSTLLKKMLKDSQEGDKKALDSL